MSCSFYNRLLFIVIALTLILPSRAISQSVPSNTLPNPVEESLPDLVVPLPTTVPPPAENLLQREEEDPAGESSVTTPPAQFFIEDIQVLGNTLFSDEIEVLVAPLEGREITLAELLDLRSAITDLYVKAGYVSSGAFVPTNQELADKTVQIQVIEGELEQIEITGLSRLREQYVRDRLSRAVRSPLNVVRLEEGLRLLQIDPVFRSVNAELAPGSIPGRNSLILALTEADAFSAVLSGNNYRSPSIGSLQGTASAEHINLLGFGDRLSLAYSLTEGLDNYQASYRIPINGLDGSLQVRYQQADSNIVQEPFQDAGIRSESETLSFNYRQPLTRSVSNELALGLGFDVRESRSFILDNEPFSFSVGPEEGVSRVGVVRFSQEWLNRDVNTVLAARSQFNIGLDTFNATVNDSGTDGRFFSWIGQFQWVEQFPSDKLLVSRFNAQLTPDSLLPLERFSVGGIETVRGYAQNQLVTDNALTLSTELRLPVAQRLQLTPFLEAGGGWNNRTANPDPSFLLGTGLGLRWQPIDALNLRVDYGIPLITPGAEGNSLQEDGLYFSIDLLPL